MSNSEPEELALRWVPGAGPVQLRPLTTGLVNSSYQVLRSGRHYSLRVAGNGGLGVDRIWECRVLGAAAAAGLAPAVECCDPVRGILVAAWAEGHAWAAGEERHAAKIWSMAALMRRIHALPVPQPARAMDPASWIAHYTRALPARTATLDMAALRTAATARLHALAAHRSVAAVLCHSDLHRQNLADGARLLALDWEYAHVSDPFWDLAGWVANNDGPEPFARELLESYLERRPAIPEWARLDLLVWLYDYVCLLWSELYLRLRGDSPDEAISARAATLAARLRAQCRWPQPPS